MRRFLNSNVFAAIVVTAGMVYLGTQIRGQLQQAHAQQQQQKPAPKYVKAEVPGFAGLKGVVVVEYADNQCPACAEAEKTVVPELAKLEAAGAITVVHRDFPLPMHTHAREAAEADRCAKDQGVMGLRPALLEKHDSLNSEVILRLGASLGAKEKELSSCIASHRHADDVELDVQEGKKLGINATPSFLVVIVKGEVAQGALIPGADPDVILSMVERLRKANK